MKTKVPSCNYCALPLRRNMRFTQSIRCAPPKPLYAQKYRTSLSWIGCLPDGNGVQLLAMLRRDARYRHLPILMLTARSSETDITKGLETALLRRSGKEERSQELHYPPLRMDLNSNQVFYQQTPFPCTAANLPCCAAS